jgi:hypothetical protein
MNMRPAALYAVTEINQFHHGFSRQSIVVKTVRERRQWRVRSREKQSIHCCLGEVICENDDKSNIGQVSELG